MSLILASSSPRRQELLRRLDLSFTVVPSSVVERAPTRGEDPAQYALELARAKARDVAPLFPSDVILAADTAVAIDDEILGKPEDAADARRMLACLRGREHIVVTGVVVRCGEQEYAGSVSAHVSMHAFAQDDIEAYITTGEPMDKAGAYAIQGLGGRLVSSVSGCLETVIGLPLCLTVELLEMCQVGAVAEEAPCTHRQ